MPDPRKVVLKMTCGACPEQYDAYLEDRLVGFLHLRNGYFHVDFPYSGGERIYEAHPRGDGLFEYEERDKYLKFAVKAILDKLDEEKRLPDVQYEINYS